MAKREIANGAFITVFVDGQEAAFVNNASYDENFNIQPVEVLNFLGPVSLDTTGYTLTVDLGFFITRDKSNIDTFINGFRLVPRRAEVKKDGFMPDREITFIDTVDGVNHAAFRGCVLNVNNSQIQPNAFVQKGLQFLGLSRTK